MVFPRPVIHGVYVLCYLSRRDPKSVVPAKEIAAQMEVPPEQASKILQALAAAGLVAAQRGRQGGYALQRPLDNIKIADVFTAINETSGEDRLAPRSCPIGQSEVCSAHAGLMRMHARFWDILSQESLANLLGAPCAKDTQSGPNGHARVAAGALNSASLPLPPA
jgi:Rrf2 family protein